MTSAAELDRIDREILRLLMQDASRSLAEIAERHGLAGPEVARDVLRAALSRLDAGIAAGLEAQRGRSYSP